MHVVVLVAVFKRGKMNVEIHTLEDNNISNHLFANDNEKFPITSFDIIACCCCCCF
jgi:hypothetical protein